MTPDAAEVRLAYARLFSDNPKKGDAEIVLADLKLAAGGVQSVAAWVSQFGSAIGYEASCHELNGKRAMFEHIVRRAEIPIEDVQKLERIVRYVPIEE